MKKTITLAVVSLAFVACIIGCNGCKSTSIQVIHNDKVGKNNVPVKAFNDETYVWENWTIGTNKVNILEK